MGPSQSRPIKPPPQSLPDDELGRAWNDLKFAFTPARYKAFEQLAIYFVDSEIAHHALHDKSPHLWNYNLIAAKFMEMYGYVLWPQWTGWRHHLREPRRNQSDWSWSYAHHGWMDYQGAGDKEIMCRVQSRLGKVVKAYFKQLLPRYDDDDVWWEGDDADKLLEEITFFDLQQALADAGIERTETHARKDGDGDGRDEEGGSKRRDAKKNDDKSRDGKQNDGTKEDGNKGTSEEERGKNPDRCGSRELQEALEMLSLH